MTDMEFGITLTVLGGGLTLVSLAFLVFVMKVLVGFQSKAEGKNESQSS